jgi:hypothetical protein
LRQSLIEPQHLGGEVFEVGSLTRKISPADADQGAEDERQQKADQPRDLAYHAFRLACLVFRRKVLLQREPGVARDHEQHENK